jgi:hypothetical protein
MLPGLWCHGLGEARGRVVAWVLRKMGYGVVASGALACFTSELPGDERAPPPDLPVDLVEAALSRQETSLARLTGQGPDFRHLPPEERSRAMRLALPPDSVRAAWRRLRWVSVGLDAAERLRAVIDPGVDTDAAEG